MELYPHALDGAQTIILTCDYKDQSVHNIIMTVCTTTVFSMKFLKLNDIVYRYLICLSIISLLQSKVKCKFHHA